MSWSGTMECQLVNSFSDSLTMDGLRFGHVWTDRSGVDGPENNGNITLGPGQTLSFTVHVGSGGHDEWVFEFTVTPPESIAYTFSRGDVAQWGGTPKQCDVEEGDYTSGHPIIITFTGYANLSSGPLGSGWSVGLHSSTSCNNNNYDQDA